MINNVNLGAITSSETASLIERVATRVDGNNDGSISKSEFAAFLSDLINRIGSTSSTTSSSLRSTLASTSSTGTSSTTLPPCPLGWDPAKWTNPAHQTPKYVVGRVLAEYPPTPAGLQQALPDVQAAIPGTRLIGDDKLEIPGVGTVDVGISFAAGGGKGWCWRLTE